MLEGNRWTLGATAALHAPSEKRIDDPEVRKALIQKRLRPFCQRDDVLVVHELGLAHARVRVDIAVLNGVLHGYEIKSDCDTLHRLETQLEIYRQSLQKLTFVVAERHVPKVLDCTPDWCGVLAVRKGLRGALRFSALRRSSRNPEVSRFVMAHLLWRDEVESILAASGIAKSALRMPRAELYELLVADIAEAKLAALIKSAMAQRQAWRDPAQPGLCGG